MRDDDYPLIVRRLERSVPPARKVWPMLAEMGLRRASTVRLLATGRDGSQSAAHLCKELEVRRTCKREAYEAHRRWARRWAAFFNAYTEWRSSYRLPGEGGHGGHKRSREKAKAARRARKRSRS